jgi:hypothetical protein
MVHQINGSAGPFPLFEPSSEQRLYFQMQKTMMKYPNLFGRLPQHETWKLLFMERDKIANGKMAYESEEQGYLEGVLNGYLFMLETLDQKLTPDLYESLHDACAKGVFSQEEPDGIPLGFRTFQNGGEAFGVEVGSTLSERGAQELFARYDAYSYKDPVTGDVFFPAKEALVNPRQTIDLTVPRSYIRLKPTRPETCRSHIAYLLSLYEKSPRSTREEKLHAIARLCQDVEQFHFFVDGNVRTAGILLLNRLLILEGLSPCVMRDVNQLDCLSENEIVELIEEGQAFFQSLVR